MRFYMNNGSRLLTQNTILHFLTQGNINKRRGTNWWCQKSIHPHQNNTFTVKDHTILKLYDQ